MELLCDQILISSLSQKNPLIFQINANNLKLWIIAPRIQIQLLFNSDWLKIIFFFWQTEGDWEVKYVNKRTSQSTILLFYHITTASPAIQYQLCTVGYEMYIYRQEVLKSFIDVEMQACIKQLRHLCSVLTIWLQQFSLIKCLCWGVSFHCWEKLLSSVVLTIQNR